MPAEDIPRVKIVYDKQYPIYIGDTAGVSTPYQKLHWHDALEINRIKSGKGYYNINGRIYEFQEGDVLLINSNDLHCAYETETLLMQVITFDLSWLLGIMRFDPQIVAPFKEMGMHYTNLLDRDHPGMTELHRLLTRMQEEHNGQTDCYRVMVLAYLVEFLAYVNRHFRVPCVEETRASLGSAQLVKIRKVITAMEEDCAYPWSLEELAALAFLSPSRFSDIFRQAVDMPPLAYLIVLRIERSQQLLDTTSMKISEIALDCGFPSLSNFNRLFKKHLGVTPMLYRSRGSRS